MRYSDEIDTIVQDSLQRLIKLKEDGSFPFQEEVVEKYYTMFKEIMDNVPKEILDAAEKAQLDPEDVCYQALKDNLK